MQREIKFKAQKIDSNEWVYGCLCHNIDNRICIEEEFVVEKFGTKRWSYILQMIKPETVSQFIEWEDRNKKEIHENEIVKLWDTESFSNEQFTTEDMWELIGVVKKYNGMWIVEFEDKSFITLHEIIQDSIRIEIIGNKFDNPKLLRG